MRPPFRLVPDAISHDTTECLEELLERARRGEIIGVAFAAMLKGKGRHYIVNSAGEAHRNPTFGLGMVRMLDNELARRVLDSNP